MSAPCYRIDPVSGERTAIAPVRKAAKPRKIYGVWDDLCQSWEHEPSLTLADAKAFAKKIDGNGTMPLSILTAAELYSGE